MMNIMSALFQLLFLDFSHSFMKVGIRKLEFLATRW